MVIAAILLAAAALGGIVMAIQRLRGGSPTVAIAIIHGLAAATGLALVGVSVLNGGKAGLALAVLFVAALGGFALASFHLRRKELPIPLMLVHALVAVVGFITLLMALR